MAPAGCDGFVSESFFLEPQLENLIKYENSKL